MSELEGPKVRDELLQAMYWTHAEGLAPTLDVRGLSTFMVVPAAGYLAAADGYGLTAHAHTERA